jgi:hypothetical protein
VYFQNACTSATTLSWACRHCIIGGLTLAKTSKTPIGSGEITTDAVQTTVRIKPDLKSRLEILADADGVSFNTLAIAALTKYEAEHAEKLADKLERAVKVLRANRDVDPAHKKALSAVIHAEAAHSKHDPAEGKRITSTKRTLSSTVELMLKGGERTNITSRVKREAA